MESDFFVVAEIIQYARAMFEVNTYYQTCFPCAENRVDCGFPPQKQHDTRRFVSAEYVHGCNPA
jgi:hypothetical protein